MNSIGNLIRENRKKKNMTQEELGVAVSVSKQAVSKWETGRTLPDMEMLRKLSVVLEIRSEELWGESVSEARRSRGISRIFILISVFLVLLLAFFALDGVAAVQRRFQSGVMYLTVFEDGVPVEASEYSVVSELSFRSAENGYCFSSDYGELCGVVSLKEYEIEFCFMNPNNWHNIQLRLDLLPTSDGLVVRQTVTYFTDGDVLSVFVSEAAPSDGKVFLYCSGI
ncbi:MAG: helix-turn-helix transcriptional regulator [Clostridia bacterium]|nr:helix-turn-helix transcriptional regulator [Clostridia bacterium]MBQ4323869.1 helix-turn-helix transcriptional regulator [Clostridia bacterium]